MKFPFAGGFLFAAILALGRAGWAQETGDTVPTGPTAPTADYSEALKRGDALYGTGTTLAWTGAALLPLSLVALIPVVYDGAFGITAADPGIGGFIAVAGVGLIHIGIPFMGVGADRLEAGTKGAKPGFEPSRTSGWSLYRQSWLLMGAGATLFAISLPFVVVAGLDWTTDEAPVDYMAKGLLYSAAGLGVAGLLEQEYCGYRFYSRRRDAKSALGGQASLSLRPVLRLGREGTPGAGLNLVARF